MDEKIYEITNKIFMYFQIKGCSIQMSNGCNPYSIIIVDDCGGIAPIEPFPKNTSSPEFMPVRTTQPF